MARAWMLSMLRITSVAEMLSMLRPTQYSQGSNGAHADFMFDHGCTVVSQAQHNLPEAFCLAQQGPVLGAEGQVASRLQSLALHIVCAAADQVLHCTDRCCVLGIGKAGRSCSSARLSRMQNARLLATCRAFHTVCFCVDQVLQCTHKLLGAVQ